MGKLYRPCDGSSEVLYRKEQLKNLFKDRCYIVDDLRCIQQYKVEICDVLHVHYYHGEFFIQVYVRETHETLLKYAHNVFNDYDAAEQVAVLKRLST